MSQPILKTKKAPVAVKLAPAWLADAGLAKRAALTLAASLVAGAAMVVSSGMMLAHRTADMEQAQLDTDRASKHFTAIVNEYLQIRDFAPRFRQLQGSGLIGEERRLDWIEAIKQSQARRGLLPIAYSIEAQQPFRMDGVFDLGDYQLRGSRMTLHMDLLHEMDLLNLLDDLRRSGAYFAAQDCSIKRASMGGGMAAGGTQAAGLVADCTLNWLTLAVPGPATGTGAATPASPGAAPAMTAGTP